jgi:hypothetical protein
MEWNSVTQWTVTFFVAAAGWWAGHYFSSRRDLVTERRKLRIKYLLEAYRKIERASNHDDIKQYWSDFESAIADIQLLGSPRQVSLARQFAISMAKNSTASLDDLIFDLRQSLRSELQLETVSENVVYLRMSDKADSQ